MKKVFPYIVGIVVAVLFYVLSMTIGSFINVFTALASGYSSYNALISSDSSISAILLLLLISLANHVFFGWLTCKLLMPYAIRKGCAGPAFFRCAAASIGVYTLLIVPLFTGKTPGWMPIISHPCALIIFGNKRLRAYNQKKTVDHDVSSSGMPTENQATASLRKKTHSDDRHITRYCIHCGAELKENARFCHKCGKDTQ